MSDKNKDKGNLLAKAEPSSDQMLIIAQASMLAQKNDIPGLRETYQELLRVVDLQNTPECAKAVFLFEQVLRHFSINIREVMFGARHNIVKILKDSIVYFSLPYTEARVAF